MPMGGYYPGGTEIIPAAYRMQDPMQGPAGAYPTAAYPEAGHQGGGCPSGGCPSGNCGSGNCGSGCCSSGCSSGCTKGCKSGCGLFKRGCCDPCDNCGRDDCCGRCCFMPVAGLASGWRVRGEGVLLHRTVADQQNYTFATGQVASLLSNDLLDFNYEWSFRVAAERRIFEDHSIEVSYMGLWNWNDFRHVNSSVNGLQSAYFDTGGGTAIGFDNAMGQDIAYSTEFHSAEINHWIPCQCDCLGAIQLSTCFGARYVKISEDFIYNSYSTAGNGFSSYASENDLVGGHFGWLVTVPLNCNWALRWGGRAGIFGNIIQQRNNVLSPDVAGGPLVTQVNEQFFDGDAAFVGGTDAQLAYRVNCGLSIILGVECLWVDGVALAAEQFNPNIGLDRSPTLNDNGTAYFQGFSFGLEYAW